jgi:hypothetical protein
MEYAYFQFIRFDVGAGFFYDTTFFIASGYFVYSFFKHKIPIWTNIKIHFVACITVIRDIGWLTTILNPEFSHLKELPILALGNYMIYKWIKDGVPVNKQLNDAYVRFIPEIIRKKIADYIENIKTGFTPVESAKGIKAFLSRFNNLWRYSIHGKVILTVAGIIFFFVLMITQYNITQDRSRRPSSYVDQIRRCQKMTPIGKCNEVLQYIGKVPFCVAHG